MHLKPIPTLLGLAVILAAGYEGWHVLGPKPPSVPPEPPATPVSAVVAHTESLPIYLRGVGTVQALNSVEIHPQVGGVLTQVPVKEGQDVKQNDVVAVIDPRPFKAALDKANAQLTQDQAQLVNAQADQQRYAALARNDFASRQQLDTQVSTVARMQGATQGDQASIEEAQINLNYTVVRSPLDGRVSLRRVDPGNLIQANATGPGIISITQVHPISMVFTLPEADVERVRAAMAKGPLTVLADPSNGGGPPAKGTLLTPDNAINAGTGTMMFKSIFPNTDDRLTPGQFVTARLQVGTATGVTVPHEAVQHGQDNLFVFTIKPDNTVETHPVTIALDEANRTVLASGIPDGATVITAGQSRIGPGTRVTTGKPAAAPAPPPANEPQSAAR